MMRIQKLKVNYTELEKVVLPRLCGQIFHVTHGNAFCSMKKDRQINANSDKKCGFTYPQSENSFGRQRGWVCLFDLREKQPEIVRETLEKFYFLSPRNWARVVFLVLDKNFYEDVKLQSKWGDNQARSNVITSEARKGTMYIPETECWYPGNICLEKISLAIAVEIINRPSKDIVSKISTNFLRNVATKSFRAVQE